MSGISSVNTNIPIKDPISPKNIQVSPPINIHDPVLPKNTQEKTSPASLKQSAIHQKFIINSKPNPIVTRSHSFDGLRPELNAIVSKYNREMKAAKSEKEKAPIEAKYTKLFLNRLVLLPSERTQIKLKYVSDYNTPEWSYRIGESLEEGINFFLGYGHATMLIDYDVEGIPTAEEVKKDLEDLQKLYNDCKYHVPYRVKGSLRLASLQDVYDNYRKHAQSFLRIINKLMPYFKERSHSDYSDLVALQHGFHLLISSSRTDESTKKKIPQDNAQLKFINDMVSRKIIPPRTYEVANLPSKSSYSHEEDYINICRIEEQSSGSSSELVGAFSRILMNENIGLPPSIAHDLKRLYKSPLEFYAKDSKAMGVIVDLIGNRKPIKTL